MLRTPILPLALVLALGLPAALSSGRASDWSSWRGPARDGQSPETGWSHDWPSEGPRILWKDGVGTGFSSMVIADGRLYTMGWQNDEDLVFCLNAVTGATNWIARYAQPLGNKMYEGGPNSTPLVVGSRVYTASKTGLVHAFDTASGNVVWKTSLKDAVGAPLSDWGVSGAPVLADARTLLVNYGPHGVALDPETGAVRWNSGRKKDMSFAAPVVTALGGKPAALFFMSEALVAVDPATGTELWRSSFGKGYRTHCSDPLVAGDRVFISSGDDGGELLEIRQSGAKRVWKNANLSTFAGTAVLVGQYLYGLDTAGYKGPEQELRCVDLATGTVKWGEKGFGQGSLIAAGDRLIVQGDKGEISVVRASPERFELLARCQPIGGKCWTTPALSDGRLYVRNARGDLACLDLNPAGSPGR